MAEELPIKKYDFSESYFPPNIKIFGIAIGIFGLVMIYFEQLVGIIPMIFCLGIIVTQHGHYFDFQNKRYRHYIKVLSWDFGKWIDLKKPKAIVISKEIIKERSNTSWSGTAIKTRVKMWQVSFFNEDEEYFVTESENIKEACTSVLIFMAMFQVKPYSKVIRKDRVLDYAALRKGIVKFGDVVFTK